MPIADIAFLSNTITKPFERFLKGYSCKHYPLDTIIATLVSGIEEKLLVVLLDIPFFSPEYEERFMQLKNAIETFRKNNDAKIIINTLHENFYDIYTPHAIKQELQLLQLNTQIASLQEEIHDVAVLDFYALCKIHGAKNLINEKNRILFQTPFTKSATELLCTKIQELITLFTTPRIKAIALDADNTLWGGIIGEEGIDGIDIDNNYPGIVYKKFQEYLLALKNSGIILLLLSKNDEASIKEVFAKKTMPLSLDDFVAYRVNWNSKSENLAALLHELKLTSSGIIFIDDSDTELQEMQQRLGLACYKSNPAAPLENIEILKNITTLRTLSLSLEDTKKTLLYKEEHARKNQSTLIASKEEFIASLEIHISVTCNNMVRLDRIVQLVNKTNQFNLTTKRYNLAQIKALMQEGFVYDFSVHDRFGDMGLVGVVIIKDNHIDTFLLSCRVLGRGIEEKILSFLTHLHPNLTASYIKSEKNSLVSHFYENNGFAIIKDGDNKDYKFQSFVDINEDIKVAYES
ncbi:MAG: HAD-IIIC family phosphatase [Candidatus Cloacimonetes bacterium]|nr:HAD-IIIC family phosphatase [Candidatus Cloacimonadota bacterium]